MPTTRNTIYNENGRKLIIEPLANNVWASRRRLSKNAKRRPCFCSGSAVAPTRHKRGATFLSNTEGWDPNCECTATPIIIAAAKNACPARKCAWDRIGDERGDDDNDSDDSDDNNNRRMPMRVFLVQCWSMLKVEPNQTNAQRSPMVDHELRAIVLCIPTLWNTVVQESHQTWATDTAANRLSRSVSLEQGRTHHHCALQQCFNWVSQ
mmetsp:Transcript_30409/g.71076  ORF Transcript_30409/g.71076 Transcript_30409/m.71076 type:complete len:208 (+) Transcript_30409:1995-2618(+)